MQLEEFITAGEITFEKILTCTTAVPLTALDEPLAEGKWPVRDLLAHLTNWDSIAVRALEAVYQNVDFDWTPYLNFDTINADAIVAAQGSPGKRVLNELKITHAAFMEAVTRVPRERLCTNDEIPRWMEKFLEHYQHHLMQIESWAAQKRPK